jgi:hypothetical protein
MIDLKSATSLINIITLTITYLCTVSVAGFFRAWVAHKVGDETPADNGFMTLNPFKHFDPLGAFLFLFFGLGWGRYIQINPFNIENPVKKLKIFAAYLSDTFAHFTLALIGLTTLIAIFGITVLEVAKRMILSGYLSHEFFAAHYIDSSPHTIAFAFILLTLTYLNISLGVLVLIMNGFSLSLLLFAMSSGDTHAAQQKLYEVYGSYIIFVVPILLILFFAEPLRYGIMWALSHVGYSLAHLFGSLPGLS